MFDTGIMYKQKNNQLTNRVGLYTNDKHQGGCKEIVRSLNRQPKKLLVGYINRNHEVALIEILRKMEVFIIVLFICLVATGSVVGI